MRPGNIPAFTRAAYLRELFGDVEGAIELMTQAYDAPCRPRWRIAPGCSHISVTWNCGRPYCQRRAHLRRRSSCFPTITTRWAAGESSSAQGNIVRRPTPGEAGRGRPSPRKSLRAGGGAPGGAAVRGPDRVCHFEQQALGDRRGGTTPTASSCPTTSAWRGSREALRIAHVEIARRQDVHTLEAYAWALHANRRTGGASIMRRALDVGVKDPEILAHAAIIAKKSGGT